MFTTFDASSNTVMTSATVNIYNPGTVTPISATIFDRLGNPLSNPLTSDANTGLIDFYLTTAQEVDIVVSKALFTTRTFSNVPVLDDSSLELTALLTTTGDMVYASSANTPVRLAVGTNNYTMITNSSIPKWTSALQVSDANGNAAIGTTVAANVGLWVGTTSTLTNNTQAGIQSNVTYSSAATTLGAGVYSLVSTQAASFTMASGASFYAVSPTVGASSSITNEYGLYVQNQGASGITNAYGVYVNAQSGAATTNIGLYNGGTTQLVGAVGIGIATNPAVQLVFGGTALSSGNAAYGIYVNSACDSSSTTGFVGIFSKPTTAAAPFTAAVVQCFRAALPVAGAGSTITSASGLYVESMTSGGTNNYGIFINLPSGGATENFAIKINGQTANAIAIENHAANGNDTIGFNASDFFTVVQSGANASSATAGSNGDVPAQVSAYWQVQIGATNYKIPLYNP